MRPVPWRTDITDPKIGRTVSKYLIEKKLGSGAMGVVYLAHDTKLNRPVALKFLTDSSTNMGENRQRLLREARVAAALSHPAICTIHEIDETDWFIAMEYVQGQTLKDLIASSEKLELKQIMKMTEQVVSGLQAAHEHGIVHRDIKPDNIMVTPKGDAVIMDFGIAKSVDATLITQVDTTLGTAAYMSPEQAQSGVVDHRTDIWSLGACLYEMVTGERPFRGEHIPALLYSVVNQAPQPITELRPDVPEGLVQVIERMLAKSPADRYLDCEELLADLKGLRTGEILKPQRTIPWLIMGIFLAVIASGVFYLWSDRNTAQVSQPTVVDESVTEMNDSQRIVILPFTFSGDENYRWLGKGLMDLMITNLGGTQTGHTVSGSTVLYAIDQVDSNQSRPDGNAVARFLNVNRFVQGEIFAVGGQLRISAELHDRSSPNNEPQRGNVAGSVEDLFPLVDELAGQLLVQSTYRMDERDAGLARDTTNLSALKEYLLGLQFARTNASDEAIKAFQRAVEEDSTFALAWYNLSLHQNSSSANQAAIIRAIEQSGDLPERDQLMMSGRLALLNGEFNRAEQVYRQVLRDNPQDVYALLELELMLWESTPGRSPYEAIPYARRILELAPDFGNWMRFHITCFAIDTGDLEYLAAHPPCGSFIWLCPLSKLVQAYDQSPSSTVDVLDEPGPWLTKNFDFIRPDPVVSLELGRRMLEPTCTPETRLFGRIQLASLNTARGRLRAAQVHLDSLVNMADMFAAEYPGFVPATAIELQAFYAVMPFIDPKPGLVDSLWSAIEIWDPESVADFDPWPTNNGRHGLIRLYLLGLLDVARSDLTRALQYADEIEKLAPDRPDGPAALDLASGIRARVAFERGEGNEALAFLEAVPRQFEHWRYYSIFIETLAERHLRGEIFFSLGRYDEALIWFESTKAPSSMLFNAVRFYYQARCHEALGDHEAALEDYRKFVNVWGDCDPDQRRLIDDAQQRLIGLEGA